MIWSPTKPFGNRKEEHSLGHVTAAAAIVYVYLQGSEGSSISPHLLINQAIKLVSHVQSYLEMFWHFRKATGKILQNCICNLSLPVGDS